MVECRGMDVRVVVEVKVSSVVSEEVMWMGRSRVDCSEGDEWCGG